MVVPGAWDELDDVGTQSGSSHIAIAIRPISASDIRYAVIDLSSEKKCAADRGDAIISGANRIPAAGAACGCGFCTTPHAGTFARAGE